MPDKPKLIWDHRAVDDLSKIREFIDPQNKKAALNAAQRIIKSANLLLDNPYLGRPLEDMPEFSELFIPFGQRGYVMRYRVENKKIIILRCKYPISNTTRS